MCSYLQNSVAENFGKCGLNLYVSKLQDKSVKGLSVTLKSIRMQSRSKFLIEAHCRKQIYETHIMEYSTMMWRLFAKCVMSSIVTTKLRDIYDNEADDVEYLSRKTETVQMCSNLGSELVPCKPRINMFDLLNGYIVLKLRSTLHAVYGRWMRWYWARTSSALLEETPRHQLQIGHVTMSESVYGRENLTQGHFLATKELLIHTRLTVPLQRKSSCFLVLFPSGMAWGVSAEYNWTI